MKHFSKRKYSREPLGKCHGLNVPLSDLAAGHYPTREDAIAYKRERKQAKALRRKARESRRRSSYWTGR